MIKYVKSGGYKKPTKDTRNNWVTMMFVTHNRYMCFRKQSHINTCLEALRECEQFGFEFGEFGFGGNHCSFSGEHPETLFYTRCGGYLEITKCKKDFSETSWVQEAISTWRFLEWL